ncbi:MAG TPA: hypothetical protein VEK15_17440 [Vicinamibacteria bacterium]|nr:hypothetical protein [Vicinamibacteria bacterium]
MLEKTRLSLFYLASYLWLGGVAMILSPTLAAELLQSNAHYPPVMLRALGMFMIGLGIIVVQIIRHRLDVLYATTVVVRLFFCLGLLAFYISTGDPFFLVLFGIVALGVAITGVTYLGERQKFPV